MLEIIILLIVLACAVLVGSILGFGDSLIFIPLAALFLDVKLAVVLMGFWTTSLSVLNAIKYWDHIDRPFVKRYFIPGMAGIILGSFMIVESPTRWIELFLGLFVLVYVIAKFRELARARGEVTDTLTDTPVIYYKPLPKTVFYPGAFGYGLLSGLIGASGPINIVLLERSGHEKESFIGTFSIISVILGSVKLNIFVWTGLFPPEYFWVLLLGFGLIFIVVKGGHYLAPKIPKTQFQLIVLLFLLIIAFRLILISLFFYEA